MSNVTIKFTNNFIEVTNDLQSQFLSIFTILYLDFVVEHLLLLLTEYIKQVIVMVYVVTKYVCRPKRQNVFF